MAQARDSRGRFIRVSIEGDSSGLEGSLDDGASAMDDFAGAGAAGFGSKLALGLAAAAAVAGAAFMKGLTDAMDNEQANDLLAAQLGLTAAESERAGGIAGDLYRDAYGGSLGEVNEALRGTISMMGGLGEVTDEELSRMTAMAVDFSTVFGEDVSQTTRAVGQLLRNGLAPDAETAFDLMTVAMQNGANAGDDFLDTISEYSTKFRDLGLNGQSAMGLISQAMQAGARDSDFVADSLKELAIRAIDGSTGTAEGFAAVGLNAQEMGRAFAAGGGDAARALHQTLTGLRAIEDPMARDAAAVQLFGTKAEDLGDAIYAMDLATASAQFDDFGGAAEEMGATLADNAGTKVEQFKRTVLGGLADFMANNIIPGLERLTEIGQGFADNWEQWTGSLDMGETGAKFDEFKATFSETFNTIGEIFTRVGTLFSEVWDRWGADITAFLSEAWAGLQIAFGGFAMTVQGLADTVKAILDGDWAAVWDGLWKTVEGVLTFIGGAVQALGGAILASLTGIGGIIVQWASDALPNLAAILEEWVPVVLNWIGSAVASLPGRLMEFLDAFALWASTVAIPGIQAKAGEMGAALLGWIGDAVGALGGKLAEFGSGIINWIIGMPGQIASAAAGMWDGITGSFRNMINGIIAMWNNLAIPSFTIGGFDAFGVTLPSVNTPRIDFPNLPQLAGGGFVTHPTLALIGEGRDDEIVSPVPVMEKVTRRSVEEVLSARGLAPGGGRGGALPVTISLDGRSLWTGLLPVAYDHERAYAGAGA